MHYKPTWTYLSNGLRIQRQQINIVDSFGETVRLNSHKYRQDRSIR